MINSGKNANPIEIKRKYIHYLLDLLTPRGKIEYFVLTISQMLFSLLDILGVVAIGLLGTLTVNGIQSKPSGEITQRALAFLNLDGSVFQKQVAVLGLLAGLILVSRTIFSILLTRRTLYFLSLRAAGISSGLATKILASNYEKVRAINSQDTLYAISNGVNSLLTGVLGNISTFIADLFLLTIMLITLIVVDPLVALITVVLFGGLALTLYFGLQRKARSLGSESARMSIENYQTILDTLSLFREIKVRNLEKIYSDKITTQRFDLSLNNAQSAFLPNVSKYAIEIALVIGTIAIAALQFLSRDATAAISVLAIFLASGSRIAPAVLRLQQGAIAIKGATGAAGPTLMILKMFNDENIGAPQITQTHKEQAPSRVIISNLSFRYQNSSEATLKDINLTVEPGEAIAIIGPSGSGKSTLVNLILGVLLPTEGSIQISDKSPAEISQLNPGYLAYVPQEIHFIKGTLRENLTLGQEDIQPSNIKRALDVSNVNNILERLSEGLDTQVEERASNLSGGEKQRIGIARALTTNPKIIVLDEATSALDGGSEIAITDALAELKGSVTTIIIAHRLTSVKECDRVVYLEKGKISAVGSLSELRTQIPDLDAQLNNLSLIGESK